MKYQSTRGKVSQLTFKQAVMMGLASDGGLLLPESIPDVSQCLPEFSPDLRISVTPTASLSLMYGPCTVSFSAIDEK